MNVRQRAQFCPDDSMLAFASAACDELSKRSETCDSHLGFSGPVEVHQGNQGHLMLFSVLQKHLMLMCTMCSLISKKLAQINWEHEPLPRQVKAFSFCLSFGQLTLGLLAISTNQEIGLAFFYALINKSENIIFSRVYLVNKDVFQTSQRVRKELWEIFGGEEVRHLERLAALWMLRRRPLGPEMASFEGRIWGKPLPLRPGSRNGLPWAPSAVLVVWYNL